jgi:hypothetical protein
MPAVVTLEVTEGPLQGQVFRFDQHDTFLFGRAPGCHALLSPDDTTASRHHFLLEVNPPDARLRDLGSLNGTFVNDVKVGGRSPEETPEEALRRRLPEIDIHDGDRIGVGSSTLVVRITTTSCHRCGREIPEAFRSRCRVDGGPRLVCPDCRQAPRVEGTVSLAPSCCDRCGRTIDAASSDRAGALLCAGCRAAAEKDPVAVIRASLRATGTADVPGYAVGEFLARGGQGAVHRARRLSDGREVAFKVMLAQVAVDEAARLLFEREIEVMRSLRHPHIVELLDHGSAGVGFWFVMEMCGGGSVDGVMRRRGTAFTIAEAGPLVLQALDGLAHAHGRGYVHRDLKPPNVLLGRDERGPAKIADFGLAKSFEKAGLSGFSATGTVGGTLAFMPREQLLDYKYVRPVSDVWSMAATLYYMLCGQLPRDAGGQDPIQVILGGAVVPLAQRGVRLPARVSEVMDRALAVEPEDRYPDAGAFRAALGSALS